MRPSGLDGQWCYVDANPLISFLQGHDHFLPRVAPLLSSAASGDVDLVTGDATVAEVMIRPYLRGDDGARTRAALGTALVDALHLATARNAGCTRFVTADLRMPSLPGLQVVRLQDLEELPGG